MNLDMPEGMDIEPAAEGTEEAGEVSESLDFEKPEGLDFEMPEGLNFDMPEGMDIEPAAESAEETGEANEALDFEKPEGLDFEMPEGLNFDMPEGTDSEIPESMNFDMPEGMDIEPAAEGAEEAGAANEAMDFEKPEGLDFEMPEGLNFDMPEGTDSEIPESMNLDMPEGMDIEPAAEGAEEAGAEAGSEEIDFKLSEGSNTAMMEGLDFEKPEGLDFDMPLGMDPDIPKEDAQSSSEADMEAEKAEAEDKLDNEASDQTGDNPPQDDIPNMEEIPESMLNDGELEDLLNSLDTLGDPTSENTAAGMSDNSAGSGDSEEGAEENNSEALNADEIDKGSNVDVSDDSLGQDEIERLLAEAAGEPNPEEGDLRDIEGSDITDILSEMTDDEDAAEIGELLEKDENHEAVSDSIGAELDALESDDAAGAEGKSSKDIPYKEYTVEELAAMTPSERRKALRAQKKALKAAAKEKKRKEREEKKQKKLEARENKKNGVESPEEKPDELSPEDIAALEKLGISQDEYKKKQTKKKGLIARLISFITEEVDEDEEGGKFAEESAVDKAVEGAADNEKILNELGEGEEKAAPKKKKEKKKKAKKPKPKKPPKPKKQPKPKKPKGPKKPGGLSVFINDSPVVKIPKGKIFLTFFMCVSMGVFIGIMVYIIPATLDMKKARNSFDKNEYGETFLALTGHSLSEEEQELYEKNLVLYRVARRYQSYENYMALGMKLEALNALVQSVEVIDRDYGAAQQYGEADRYNLLSQQVINALQKSFNVSIDKAREWLMIRDSAEYTDTLRRYVEGVPDQTGEEPLNNSPVEAFTNNEVIDKEESEITNIK
ncbi:MAG: hypothetical protein K5931_06670 [Lachnospiraceae bacterium]|nr:hypothetical protein [Lachnospiraceae bacterium]